MKSREETERLGLLHELGCAFAAHLELDDLIPFVILKCREVLDAEGVAVLLHDEASEELYFPYVADRDPEVVRRLVHLRFPANRGLAGVVLQTGESIRCEDAQLDPRFYDDIDRHTGMTTRALLGVPLSSRQGRIGVIQVVNPCSGGSFSPSDLSFLEALAGSIAVAIENAQLYRQVKESEERLRAQVGLLRRDLERRDRFGEMIGTHPRMEDVFRLMESAAASPISVLIEGETGTGKELVARGIHRASPRADGPFLALNCAALTETLLESELFGHRRGAFTGALQDKRGLFEAAAGGTILLDEVGDMAPAMQAKLLRVLQEGEVIPVGDVRARKVDVRAIASTNRDLTAAVASGTFREDLYYRLAAFPIRVPPLRERREDIPLLADHFLTAAAESHHKQIRGIEAAAIERIEQFDWPGNVRELRNEIERAVALTLDGEAIGLAQLSPKLERAVGPGEGADGGGNGPSHDGPDPADREESLLAAREAFEARFAARVLARHGGNVAQTAQALGISRVMLYRKLKKYGLR